MNADRSPGGRTRRAANKPGTPPARGQSRTRETDTTSSLRRPPRAVLERQRGADPAAEDHGFFDDYPLFRETSETANDLRRLNWRYRMMIERQSELLSGARVFDIASHDGRWSFAALKAGAAHVTGVEFREQLVANAGTTFAHYGIAADRYSFVAGDLFGALEDPKAAGIGETYDVVMCLGFLYHTLRYPELLLGIRRMQPKAVILDTAVLRQDSRFVYLVAENTENEFNAARTSGNYGGVMMTGRPSARAVEFMLKTYGFEIVEKVDWLTEGPAFPRRQNTLQYVDGGRITWIAKPV